VKRTLAARWLGRRPYEPIHALQLELVEARKAGRIGDTLLFVEHEPVITLGRGAHGAHVLASSSVLAELGVAVVSTGRGGDVTLHAPGQLVCYPILDLAPDRADVRRYVKDLNQVMQRVARAYGIAAGSSEKYIGLWADAAEPYTWQSFEQARTPVKMGAIGVRISRWVTMHGFAFNVDVDLRLFNLIVPCGIAEFGVSSVHALSDERPSLRDTAERALAAFAEIFDAETTPLSDESQR
jgi:lipoyl(octanoyl) transferase